MNMIGERQDPEKFLPMIISKVLSGETVKIHGSPGHIGTRHYLHSRNLADGIMHVLKQQDTAMFPAHADTYEMRFERPMGFVRREDRPDMYNIATADRIDNLTLAQTVADFVGKPLHYELEDFQKARPGHDAHYGLNPSKLQDTGWSPPVPLMESLEKTVKWTLAHPEWLIPG
jgi:dTDP-glucose 4,6-dehydratase